MYPKTTINKWGFSLLAEYIYYQSLPCTQAISLLIIYIN